MHACIRLAIASACATALALGSAATAATYDPDLKWRTLRTEHFDIHFHQGIEQVADEYTDVVEAAYDTMTEEIGWEPRNRIQVTLIDRTDSANGFASTVPYNTITVYVTAPTEDSSLNLYEDWSTAIFTHELTHILHMDTNHGIVRAARLVVGRVASTNDLSPAWMIEGYATFQETRHTPGGRGRASWPDMIKRTSVLEDDFPPLGNLDGFQPDPPAGNLRYLFGQDFIEFVAEQTGENVWTKWVHTYGSHIPFWLPSKRVFGKRLVPLYFEWRDHLQERYGAQAADVRERGETVSRLLSDPQASCSAPSFSPDGETLVWSCYDLRTGSALWTSDGLGFGAEVLLQDFGASYFTWRSDSKAFVYAASHLVNQFNVWSDIYLHTLGGGTTSLTAGARARDPDFSPDGSRLLYVTNRAQNNQLSVMTVDRRANSLTENTDHTQYSTPRFSPDGRAVALSVWQDGRRDLWVYSPEGEPLRRLTMDAAIDTDPVWSADGRWMFFTSDRTGIPNIYSIELETERLYQVTNVVTGAVKPTLHPSGKRMAYMLYSRDGWDIHMLDDLDPASWFDMGVLPRPLRFGTALSELVGAPAADDGETDDGAAWVAEPDPTTPRFRLPAPRPAGLHLAGPYPQEAEVLDTFGDSAVEDVFGDEQDYPFRIDPRRYNPLPSLLPRYMLPFIQTTPYVPSDRWAFTCIDPRLCPGIQVSLTSSANDALRRYAWGANVSYRTDADWPGAALTLTVNRFLPVYSIGVSHRAIAAARLTFFDPDAPLAEDGSLALFATDPDTIYWEKRSTAFASVSWPYRLRTTVFAQYSMTDRRPRFGLPSNTYLPAVPLMGYVGALSGGWRYSWSQQTAYAISREDGSSFNLVGSLLSPYLGTFVRDPETNDLHPLTQLQLTSEVREFVVNPLIANHVLAARAAGGVTFGATDFLGNYQLGGSIGDGSFSVTPDALRMIRGYPFAYDIGDMYWLGSVEYRFPLIRVNRGLGTLPAFGRNLSGAVFSDAGNAFNNPSLQTGTPASGQELLESALEDPLLGVGAEVTWRAIVAWGVGLSGRVGYAVGLTEGGFQPADIPIYAQLGGSF